MPDFSRKAAEIAGESFFTRTQLEKLFKTDEERNRFVQVRSVIREAADTNQATRRIIDMGEDAVKIFVKLGKKALIG